MTLALILLWLIAAIAAIGLVVGAMFWIYGFALLAAVHMINRSRDDA